MIAGKTTQLATDQLLNIQKQQAGTQQPNIPVSANSNQDIVINNKTENITRNNVYVPASGGQGQMKSVRGKVEAKAEQDLGKFKSWLNNEMARQNDISEARQREYRKRNVILEKTRNKLSRILNNFSQRIDASLQKNNVKGISSSFKNVLILFGLHSFAQNWPKIVEGINKIENRVVNLFGSLRDDLKEGFSKEGRFTTAIVKLLGGKEGETVGQALRGLLFDEKDGIFGYIKKLISNRLKERSEAISKIEKPNINLWDAAFSPGEAISNIADYLSNILKAIISPGRAAGETISDIAKSSSEEYNRKNKDALEEQYTKEGFIVPGVDLVRVAKNDRAIIEGTYQGLKENAIDRRGNLTDLASSYVSQSADIKRNIDLASSGEINTASVGMGFERLYKAAENKEVIPVHVDFVNTLLPKKEDRENIGIKEPVKYNYIVRPKTQEEVDSNKRSKFNYTIELRDPKLPKQEHEFISTEHPLVYELTKEQIKQLAETFTGKSNLEINVNNKEFISSIDNILKNLSGDKAENIKSTEIENIDNLFSVSNLMGQHREEEKTFLDNSRLTASAENAPEAFSEIGEYFSDTFDNTKQAWGDTTNHRNESNNTSSSDNNAGSDGKDESSSLFDKAKEVWNNIKEWRSSSAPSVSSESIEGMDKVVELSKTGLFYSNDSDSNKKGLPGPWSKHGHGYIRIGTHPNYQGKCTSGPATFYHDALGINLNSNWWNTGKPYSATGTNIGKVGFKKVWWGDKEQGYSRQAIENTGFKLEKGDIMLNFVGGLKVSNSHPGGKSAHAQMWNGEQWVSDTYQGDRSWPYGSGSKGRLGNESCQIWRLDPTENQQANSTVIEKSTTDETPIVKPELANNTGINLADYSYNNSVKSDINNFEFTNNEETSLASLSFTSSGPSDNDLKENYNKLVNTAYSSLDNIASKLRLVIKNEALHVDTTNDISSQV